MAARALAVYKPPPLKQKRRKMELPAPLTKCHHARSAVGVRQSLPLPFARACVELLASGEGGVMTSATKIACKFGFQAPFFLKQGGSCRPRSSGSEEREATHVLRKKKRLRRLLLRSPRLRHLNFRGWAPNQFGTGARNRFSRVDTPLPPWPSPPSLPVATPLISSRFGR